MNFATCWTKHIFRRLVPSKIYSNFLLLLLLLPRTERKSVGRNCQVAFFLVCLFVFDFVVLLFVFVLLLNKNFKKTVSENSVIFCALYLFTCLHKFGFNLVPRFLGLGVSSFFLFSFFCLLLFCFCFFFFLGGGVLFVCVCFCCCCCFFFSTSNFSMFTVV